MRAWSSVLFSGVVVAALSPAARGYAWNDGEMMRAQRSYTGASQWGGQGQQGGQGNWGQQGGRGGWGQQGGQGGWGQQGGRGAWGQQGGQGAWANRGGSGTQGQYGFTPYDTPEYYGYDSNYPGGRTHFIVHRNPSRGSYGVSHGGVGGNYGGGKGGQSWGGGSGWGQQTSQWG